MAENNSNVADKSAKNNYCTTKSERFFYGFYFFGQIIFYIIVGNFLSLYMTDLGIPAVVVAGVFLVAKIWDAVNDPLFGVIVDKANLKGGKYLPWVRLSTFLIPATTILLFAVPSNLSVQIKTIWVAIAYMLWDTSYTLCDVPIFALATSMTDNLKERNGLLLFNRLFVLIGGLFAIIVVPIAYPKIGWTMTVLILAVLGIAAMLPIGYKAKERFFVEDKKEPKIGELFSYLVHNKYLLVLSGAIIISSLTSLSGTVTSYVAIYCLGGKEWISVLGVIMTLPMLVAVIVTPQLIKKIDKFIVYIVCVGIGYVLSIVIYFIGYQNTTLLMAIIAVRSIFSSMSGIIVVMLVADCAEYGNFVSGERAQGIAFSVQTFTTKITAALSGSISMFFLGIIGFVEGEGAAQTPETIAWLWRMFTIVPLISGTASFFLLILGYKLRSKDVEIMLKVNAGEMEKEEALPLLSRKY